MLTISQLFSINKLLVIEQSSIVMALSITIIFFLILLVLGVRKSYKLKQENDRLNDLSTSLTSDEDNKVYKDFTDGHLYENH